MNESRIVAIGSRVILFRDILSIDLKQGYLELINNKLSYDDAYKQYENDIKKYRILVGSNCFDYSIVATMRKNLKTNEIDNFHILDIYKDSKDEYKIEMTDKLLNDY